MTSSVVYTIFQRVQISFKDKKISVKNFYYAFIFLKLFKL